MYYPAALPHTLRPGVLAVLASGLCAFRTLLAAQPRTPSQPYCKQAGRSAVGIRRVSCYVYDVLMGMGGHVMLVYLWV